MKKFTLKFTLLAVILIFSSCSNDDDVVDEKEPAMGTLSFGAMLNGINENRSSHLNGIPDCSEEAPAYVEVIMSGTTNVGTEAAPEVIAFTPTPADNDVDGQDEFFTEAILDLEAGNYILESFNVYDADDNLIWVAPEGSGSFAEFVNNPLPLSITVEADVENYTVVDVLCFDNRELDAYGDLVFGLNENKALEFCISAEYCAENEGDQASVSVNIWLGNDADSTELYSGVMNDLTSPEGDAICFALPDLAQYANEEEYLYYEVTIQDHPETYGDVEQNVISGTLSRADIQENFVGETQINAEELSFACDENDVIEPDPTPSAEILSGNIIGHESSWNDNPATYVDAAFDDNIETFVDGPSSIGHLGYDLGEGNAAQVTSIKFFPRSTHPERMVNNEFRGSNDPDYINNYTVLHTVTEEPSTSEFTEITISDEQEYRYIYMYSRNSANIAELEFYGVSAD